MFEVQANVKNIRLKCSTGYSIPAIINSDPYRLRQIIINLIGEFRVCGGGRKQWMALAGLTLFRSTFINSALDLLSLEHATR